LASEQITAPQAKAIRSTIMQLCADIRPFAIDLVDSFGVPEEILKHTIAGDWLSVNSKDSLPSKH
jgi:hypothetical protein